MGGSPASDKKPSRFGGDHSHHFFWVKSQVTIDVESNFSLLKTPKNWIYMNGIYRPINLYLVGGLRKTPQFTSPWNPHLRRFWGEPRTRRRTHGDGHFFGRVLKQEMGAEAIKLHGFQHQHRLGHGFRHSSYIFTIKIHQTSRVKQQKSAKTVVTNTFYGPWTSTNLALHQI